VIGYQAGQSITSGSRNILIGDGVETTGGAANDEINIGDIYYGSLVSYNAGIGVADPSEKLEVNGSVLATAYLYTSDEKLKKDIVPVTGLDLVKQLRGVSFTFKDSGRPAAGVIAQDVQKVLPSAVKENEKGFLTVDYLQLFAPVIEAVKDLASITDRHAERITQLEKENTALKSRLETVEAQNADILRRVETLEKSSTGKQSN
jgi:hypothetical protein